MAWTVLSSFNKTDKLFAYTQIDDNDDESNDNITPVEDEDDNGDGSRDGDNVSGAKMELDGNVGPQFGGIT